MAPALATAACAVLIAAGAIACVTRRRASAVGGGTVSAEECVPLTATRSVRTDEQEGDVEASSCRDTAPVLNDEHSDDDELFSAGPPPV